MKIGKDQNEDHLYKIDGVNQNQSVRFQIQFIGEFVRENLFVVFQIEIFE